MILEQRKWKKGVGDRLGEESPAPGNSQNSTRCNEVYKAERKTFIIQWAHSSWIHWSLMTPHISLLATSHSFLTLEVIPKQLPGFPAVIQNNMCARSILLRAEDLGTLFGTAKLPYPFSFLQMKQSTLLNAPAALQELPSHQNESKWKPEWRKQAPYPRVNRNPRTAQVVRVCSQVRKEGANKHELLTNPGSTNCILFQNSLCSPAQPRLASLQLALRRMRKKTSPFSPFHASMNSAHKQTPRRQIHNHLWGVGASCTLSSTLGKQTGRECFTILTALLQKHFLYAQGNFPLEDANQNSNVDQSGDEGRNTRVSRGGESCSPHPLPSPTTHCHRFVHIPKGTTEVPELCINR